MREEPDCQRVTLCISCRSDTRRDANGKKATLAALGALHPSRSRCRTDLKVLLAFNECHLGCPPGVYFYDASEIGLTRARKRERGRREENTALGERKRHEATITIEEFLLLRSFYLSLLSASQFSVHFRSLFFLLLFFLREKAPRLISSA